MKYLTISMQVISTVFLFFCKMNESASVKSKPTRSPKLYYPMVLPPLVNNFRFPIQLIFHFIFSASPTFLLYQSTVTFLISFVFRYFFFCVQNTHPWFLNPWYIMEAVLIHLRIFTQYLGGPYLAFFRFERDRRSVNLCLCPFFIVTSL